MIKERLILYIGENSLNYSYVQDCMVCVDLHTDVFPCMEYFNLQF